MSLSPSPNIRFHFSLNCFKTTLNAARRARRRWSVPATPEIPSLSGSEAGMPFLLGAVEMLLLAVSPISSVAGTAASGAWHPLGSEGGPGAGRKCLKRSPKGQRTHAVSAVGTTPQTIKAHTAWSPAPALAGCPPEGSVPCPSGNFRACPVLADMLLALVAERGPAHIPL